MSIQARHRRPRRFIAALSVILATTPLAACLSSETFDAYSQHLWETAALMEDGGRNGYGPDYPARTIRALESRSRHRGDRVADRSRGTASIVSFAGLDHGQRVAVFGDDFFIRAISAVVGPDGHVTAWRPDDVIERHGNVWGAPAEIDRLSNVSVDRSAPSGLRLPPDLDVVLLLGSYHALQSGEDGPGTTAAMNAAILEALRPGGSLVILDRQTSDEAEGATSVRLHQIDADRVMAEARAAGFYFESRRFRPLLLEAPAVTPVNAVMLRFGKRAVIPPYSPRE